MSGTDWEEQLDGKTVEQAWTTVRSQIDAAVASCIPKKTTARSRKPWNTSVTIGKFKMKKNMYRRWRNSKDNEDYLSYGEQGIRQGAHVAKQSGCTRRILPARSNRILNNSGDT